MFAISPTRAWAVAVILAALACGATSCQKQQAPAGGDPDLDRIFGNGFRDASPVIAKAGYVEITRDDFDRRLAELSASERRQYSGDGWERRFLRFMVNEALLYQEGQKRHIERDPTIAQTLISDRRFLMVNTMRERELVKNVKPTEGEIRAYYERNPAAFMVQGTIRARHIQCRDRAMAFEVYNTLQNSRTPAAEFPRQVARHSTNIESAKQEGDLGWFNRKGFIPALPNAQTFSDVVFDWPIGLHEPVQVGTDWHVVEILQREEQRPLTLEEAHDQIVTALTPMLQQQSVDDFLRQARKTASVQYFGSYAPGDGLNPRDLIRLAQYAQTREEKLDLYKQVLEDFADSEYVDDALFLMGNLYLDEYNDLAGASHYLEQLLRERPDSEFVDQARYILENMQKPGFRKPQSVEDLRKQGGA